MLRNLLAPSFNGYPVLDAWVFDDSVAAPALGLRNLIERLPNGREVFDTEKAGVPGWVLLNDTAAPTGGQSGLLFNDIKDPALLYRMLINWTSIPWPALDIHSDGTGRVQRYGAVVYDVMQDNLLTFEDPEPPFPT